MSLPLANVRVVSLEQAVAAPLCTKHLADLGADVVKVERPDGGDFARRYDSVVHGQSSWFVWLNRSKRSIVLDVKAPADHSVLEALLARADVFVHNLGPGAVDRLGFGWRPLHERWPRLIDCAVSGYGIDGPYRDRKAFDLLVQGESAVMSVTGSEHHPAKVGISIADISAGVYAFSAIMAALYDREHTGDGSFIDISMLECLAEWISAPAFFQLYGGKTPERTGMRHNAIVPYGPYRCGDGNSVNLGVQNEAQWRRLCSTVLRKPELADDPRFQTNELRLRNRIQLETLMEEILVANTRAEVLDRLEAADVPYGSLNELSDLLAHPQLAHRGRWLDVPDPSGLLRVLAHPLNISGLPQRRGSVPSIGQHTAEILRELGMEAPQ